MEGTGTLINILPFKLKRRKKMRDVGCGGREGENGRTSHEDLVGKLIEVQLVVQSYDVQLMSSLCSQLLLQFP